MTDQLSAARRDADQARRDLDRVKIATFCGTRAEPAPDGMTTGDVVQRITEIRRDLEAALGLIGRIAFAMGDELGDEGATLDLVARIADVKRSHDARPLEAVERVRALHSDWRIYNECECADKATPEHKDIDDVGLTCNVHYVICQECCVDDIYQSEVCVDYHDHTLNEAHHCPTIRVLDGA